MKTNVTYVISDIDKAIAFEWIVERIDKDKINMSFILINSEPSFLLDYLKQAHIAVYSIRCKSKKNIPFAIWQCCKILKELKSEIVHCHLFMANMIGLTAAKLLGIKSRLYTRHHSDYHHIYYPGAVKWDKYCNKLATQIVSISDNVTNILVNKEKVSFKKVIKIPHGFDVTSFTHVNKEEVSALQAKYNPIKKGPVIGVISRFITLKGVQYIIPAFKQLLNQYPNALLLLFNAKGSYEKELDKLFENIPSDSYTKIRFENNVTSLYKIFDLFIHVPVTNSAEAFGQTYVECMLSEIPLIATRSGVGNEIMVNRYNCLEVPYENSEEIYNAIVEVLQNPKLLSSLTKNAKQTVVEKFAIEKMISALEKLYLHECYSV